MTKSERVKFALEVARLRKALQKIANLPLDNDGTRDKHKAEPIIRARRIAVAALAARIREAQS